MAKASQPIRDTPDILSLPPKNTLSPVKDDPTSNSTARARPKPDNIPDQTITKNNNRQSLPKSAKYTTESRSVITKPPGAPRACEPTDPPSASLNPNSPPPSNLLSAVHNPDAIYSEPSVKSQYETDPLPIALNTNPPVTKAQESNNPLAHLSIPIPKSPPDDSHHPAHGPNDATYAHCNALRQWTKPNCPKPPARDRM